MIELVEEATSNVAVAWIAGLSGLFGSLLGSASGLLQVWWKDQQDRRAKEGERLRTLYEQFVESSRLLFQQAWAMKRAMGEDWQEAYNTWAASHSVVEELWARINLLETDARLRVLVEKIVAATDVNALPVIHPSAPMPKEVHATFFSPRSQLIAALRSRYGVRHK